MRLGIVGCTALALSLAACSQQSAPSDKVEQAATEIVEAAQGEVPETPRLADGPFAPRDECIDLKDADEFRQKLAEAVEARDLNGLIALAASDIKLDFGGGSGTEELRKRLIAEDSPLWSELDQLMALGCAANAQGGITIPWYFAQNVPGDPARTMIVTGERVPILSAETGEPLDRLSWETVTLVDGWHSDRPFQQVSHGEIESGYIATPKLRSVIDYRLIASSRNGKWSITSFIAGD
ncbi:hypothetical protein FHS61_002416 [Altererythrobacter atlanticus]|uniref:Uncharacterized protein n=1 Tax=Croceibacterium atlanticum TaxID=1267766 RepID=A0A0F7KSE8_9SPHN|nr:hypothetical protein [Croceibacterium atlanticum]AKH42051.1 hypothetical protein WYH_01003 [Croceibacterium atlanticum]MBB5733381.1 hypothetical protein [Croceibacterium atlanticum]